MIEGMNGSWNHPENFLKDISLHTDKKVVWMAADFSLVSVEARGEYNNTFNMHKVKRCHNRILHPLKAKNLSQNILR